MGFYPNLGNDFGSTSQSGGAAPVEEKRPDDSGCWGFSGAENGGGAPVDMGIVYHGHYIGSTGENGGGAPVDSNWDEGTYGSTAESGAGDAVERL